MKIGPSPTPPGLQREPPTTKPPKTGSNNLAPANTTVTLSDAAQNAEAPAGLLKTQARLQDMGETRTRGQGVALERISRNIARYLENQAPTPAATPPAVEAPPSVESPAADPVAESPTADVATPTDTASEPPADNTPALLDTLDNPQDTNA